MKKYDFSLLIKLAIGIIVGILIGLFAPEVILRIVATFEGLFSNYLNFVVPLIIVAFVIPGIADLGGGAQKVLGFSVFMSYFSTVLWGFLAYFASLIIIPSMFKGVAQAAVGESAAAVAPFFTIEMPPLLNITSAIILAFIIGIGISVTKAKTIREVALDLNSIVSMILDKTIIPLLPYFIASIFAQLAHSGSIGEILKVYGMAMLFVIVFQIIANLLEFVVAYAYAKPELSFGTLLRNTIPAWLTGLGTQSSAATIPVTMQTAENNHVSKDVRDFFIPLSGTIHFPGSSIAITIFSMAVIYMNDMTIGFGSIVAFIMLMGVTMVAAPGIPGGAIMAAIGLLQVHFGFNDAQVALMIALYLAQDSFGTAASVAGNSALVLIIDKNAQKHAEKA